MERFLTLILIALLAGSCVKDHVLTIEEKMPSTWKFSNSVHAAFQLDELNTDAMLRTDIIVEHNETFPFENLYVKYQIIADGDTIDNRIKSLQLQDELDKWIGKKNYEHQYCSTHELLDSISGKYKVIEVFVTQYSRMDSLPGISKIIIGLASH